MGFVTNFIRFSAVQNFENRLRFDKVTQSLKVKTFLRHSVEKVAINDALPLKAARRDAIATLKSFWGFESELQTNPMPFHLDS